MATIWPFTIPSVVIDEPRRSRQIMSDMTARPAMHNHEHDTSSHEGLEIDDEDLSVVDYARRHGLSRDYLAEDLLDFPDCHNDHDSRSELDCADLQDLFAYVKEDVCIQEKMALDLDGIRYLFDITSSQHVADDIEYDMPCRRLKTLRLIPPLLRTDPDLDLVRSRRRRDQPLMQDRRDWMESDLGIEAHLDWPLDDPQYQNHADLSIDAEIWSIGAEAAMYLQSVTSSGDDGEEIYSPRRVHIDEKGSRMSPPLLPLSPQSMIARSPDNCSLPPTSDPEDPTSLQLETLDDDFFADDTFDIEPSAIHAQLPLAGLGESPSPSSLRKRQRPGAFKLDAPLLPIDSLSSPFKRLRRVEHDTVASMPIMSSSSPGLGREGETYDQFFDEMVDLAAPVERALARERLQEADTRMRVRVPDLLDHARPVAPWTKYSCVRSGWFSYAAELEAQMEALVVLNQSWSGEKWHAGGEGKLIWNPIPTYSAAVRLVEDLADSEPTGHGRDASGYIAAMLRNTRIETDDLVWKPDGLRILDGRDDDEGTLEGLDFGIEVVVCTQPTDGDVSVPGANSSFDLRTDRKYFDMRATESKSSDQRLEPDTWLSDSAASTFDANHHSARAPAGGIDVARDGHTFFSATTALDAFMRVQMGR